MGAGSARYVQPNENSRERNELTTNARILNLSRLCKRISCYAELAMVLVNRDIPIAQNAAESANDRPIESGSDGITEKK